MVTRSLLTLGLATLLFGVGFASLWTFVAGLGLLALALLAAFIELVAPLR